ncbi:MAG: glutamate--cysteine ligase [Deltaproteobacteria bacterium]|nr:glutamate--cysteine ligase [Deltaproteobacteria bacterium]
MPTASDTSDAPITREEDLLGVFEQAFRPGVHTVGIECERVGLFPDGSPLRYHARPGVQDLFAALVERHGWEPVRDAPEAPVLALSRGRASITLEPGSQFELSAAPHGDVHEVARELLEHREELQGLASVGGIAFLGVGFHPFARQDDLDWVPKPRYPIMREHLPTRGAYGLDMMRRTATVQANFDFASEADAMKKLRVALAMSPVVTALMANSMVVEGQLTGEKSRRARVWTDMDRDRSGLLPFAWGARAGLGDYVQWALDVPMFIVKREASTHRATHLTFRRFLREGLEGHRATLGDWETHLNTLFPEARIKRTLEVRGADAAPARYALGLPAWWVGILYDSEALDAATALLLPYGHDAWQEVRARVVHQGLKAPLGGTTLGHLARALLALADQGLARRAVRDPEGRDERAFLEPLKALAEDDRCVGDALLSGWSPAQPDAVRDYIQRTRF